MGWVLKQWRWRVRHRFGFWVFYGVSHFPIGGLEFIFVMNFNATPQGIKVPADAVYKDALTGLAVSGSLNLTAFDAVVLTTSSGTN